MVFKFEYEKTSTIHKIVITHLWIYTNECISSVVEFLLKGDDNNLEVSLSLFPDVLCYLAYVGVVKGSILSHPGQRTELAGNCNEKFKR